MTPLVSIAEPQCPGAGAQPPGLALWQLGFRPFYLLASVFASLSIALWSLQFTGLLGTPYLAGPLWHAHEMLFGFALAVVVGFLFTAGRNWSNQPTPTGVPLMALAALWVAGRILVLTPYGWAAAIANAAFPLAAAVALAIPFWAARNGRNYFFVALLALIGIAQLGVHLAQLGVLEVPPWAGVQIGLDALLFIMAVMAGRVVPMFTNNAIATAGAERRAVVEKAALGSVLALLAADAARLDAVPMAAVLGVALAAHTARWMLWKPWRTTRVPLVWVLHLAYAWIPLYLVLRAAAELGALPPSPATHALTVGAVGGLVIGMMTRTARGHTGLRLQADRFDVASYVLVFVAAAVRVGVPLAAPAWTSAAILASGACWSLAFALYAVRYAPRLARPRVDGRPG
jgi:uncharacterized protein involved in response to NO